MSQTKLDGIIVGEDHIPILDQILVEMESLMQIKQDGSVATQIQNNKHNPVTATYYLLIKKYERNTDQNLVFGKFTRDKRMQEQTNPDTKQGALQFNVPKGAAISNSIGLIGESTTDFDLGDGAHAQLSAQKIRSCAP